jgi:hypothetical protein
LSSLKIKNSESTLLEIAIDVRQQFVRFNRSIDVTMMSVLKTNIIKELKLKKVAINKFISKV